MVSGKSDRGCGPTGRWCRDAKPDKLWKKLWGKWGGNWNPALLEAPRGEKTSDLFCFCCIGSCCFGPAHTESHRHTWCDALTPSSPHGVWFGLVLLLVFVNSAKRLCMSEPCNSSDFWMKADFYLSLSFIPNSPYSYITLSGYPADLWPALP